MLVVRAIVTAAGLSTRFGGPNKLLQPWDGSTVVGSVVNTLLGCGLEVVVVTGRDAEAVAEAVSPCRCVFNLEFQEGLGRSIACGVASSAAADGYLVVLGDMPGLRREVVEALISRLDSTDSIVAPVYSDEPDRPGHPVLFGNAYRGQLEALAGDAGARSIMQTHRDHLVLIPVEGGLPDVDLPEDIP